MNKEEKGEVILYQADNSVKLEVKLENETVWLTQAQMAELFKTTKQNVSLHINNAFKEGELTPKATVKESLTVQTEGTRYIKRKVAYYSLDVIISVGYRVKSNRGTLFRQWANKVLKDYLLRGYAVNQRLMLFEERMDARLSKHDSQIADLTDKVDFFVKTTQPPKQGVFFQGQIFDAYAFFENLIQKAENHIVLIDAYIDLSVLERFAQKKPEVTIDLYTGPHAKVSDLDIKQFNRQYAGLSLHKADKMHDRFLVIDDKELYHIGASLKDLGTKCFAFQKMDDAEALIPDILRHL